jgi:hypothetical protein
VSRLSALLICTAVGIASPLQAAPTAKSFEGVWKHTKSVTKGVHQLEETRPQPNLLIFYRGFYSIVRDDSSTARKPSPAPKDPARLTDAEKIARYDEWAPFKASAGTYEVIGNRLVTHNVVAKQAKGMTITEEVQFTFAGNSFLVRPPGSNTQLTYTRVR